MSEVNEAPQFEAHIRPLFRDKDHSSMQFAFDLWDYGDVKEHAGEILERVANGTMPCDGTWPPEQVSVFQSWVEAGCPE